MENKFIVNKAKGVARMRIYNEIDSEGYTLDRFLYEFDELEKDDSIEEIEIWINCLGGSTVKGFPIITAIKNSTKKITTICDAIGASFGALIFLAGQERKMHSYSQLMLHSARYEGSDKSDDLLTNTNQSIFDFVKAVTKRAKDKIKSWLSKDTFFTASQALENNLATHIIDTKMLMVDSYQNEVRMLVAKANGSIDEINNLKNKYSNMQDILNALELQSEATESEVKTKIQEIKNALAIKQEELVNRDSKITELTAKLKTFEDKEKAEKEKAINDLVEDAFKDRKINADGKSVWKNILEVDYDNGSKALKSLTKTEKLSDIISTDATDEQPKIFLSEVQLLNKNSY